MHWSPVQGHIKRRLSVQVPQRLLQDSPRAIKTPVKACRRTYGRVPRRKYRTGCRYRLELTASSAWLYRTDRCVVELKTAAVTICIRRSKSSIYSTDREVY